MIRIKDLCSHADRLHCQHLRSQLQTATTTGDERLNATYATGCIKNTANLHGSMPPSGQSCLQAQEIVNGQLIIHTDKIGVEGVIQCKCAAHFWLGHSAPISCSQVGYLTDSTTALKIISGTFEIPLEMDTGTAILLSRIGKVGKVVQTRDCQNQSHSNKDNQQYYSWLNKNTSSAFSCFHLGHHMALAKLDDLSNLLADHMTLIISSRVCPACWGVALQVLIEKVAGISMVELYEGDYKCFNKLVFNDQELSALNKSGFMPK